MTCSKLKAWTAKYNFVSVIINIYHTLAISIKKPMSMVSNYVNKTINMQVKGNISLSFFIICTIIIIAISKILIFRSPTAIYWKLYSLWKAILPIKHCGRITTFIKVKKVNKFHPWTSFTPSRQQGTLIWRTRPLVRSKLKNSNKQDTYLQLANSNIMITLFTLESDSSD